MPFYRNIDPQTPAGHRTCERLLALRAALDQVPQKTIDDKLLLATGVTPRRLPVGGQRVIYYRTVDSYHRLRQEAEPGRRFAVIGGGFIGSEIAAALATNGVEVTMIFPEEAIGDRLFPADLAGSLNDLYRERGIELLPAAIVTDVVERGGPTSSSRGCGPRIH